MKGNMQSEARNQSQVELGPISLSVVALLILGVVHALLNG